MKISIYLLATHPGQGQLEVAQGVRLGFVPQAPGTELPPVCSWPLKLFIIYIFEMLEKSLVYHSVLCLECLIKIEANLID